MEEYNEIVEKFKELESTQQSLAQISREYGFTVEEIDKDDNNVGGRYEIIKASKQVGEHKLLIKVETRDSYRSFGGNNDEPYFNTIELWKGEKLVNTSGYTYFK
jgi:REP element-mobilizing transposase RayT